MITLTLARTSWLQFLHSHLLGRKCPGNIYCKLRGRNKENCREKSTICSLGLESTNHQALQMERWITEGRVRTAWSGLCFQWATLKKKGSQSSWDEFCIFSSSSQSGYGSKPQSRGSQMRGTLESLGFSRFHCPGCTPAHMNQDPYRWDLGISIF